MPSCPGYPRNILQVEECSNFSVAFLLAWRLFHIWTKALVIFRVVYFEPPSVKDALFLSGTTNYVAILYYCLTANNFKMVATTRSHQPLRRGRSLTETSKRKPAKKEVESRLINQPLLFPLRNFTSIRKKRVTEFCKKAKLDPRHFGAIGTEKWFQGLAKEINEPDVVLLGNIHIWFDKYPEIFMPNKRKRRNKSKHTCRKDGTWKDETWSITTQASDASDDEKASFVKSLQPDEPLDEDVLEYFQNPTETQEVSKSVGEVEDLKNPEDFQNLEVEDFVEAENLSSTFNQDKKPLANPVQPLDENALEDFQNSKIPEAPKPVDEFEHLENLEVEDFGDLDVGGFVEAENLSPTFNQLEMSGAELIHEILGDFWLGEPETSSQIGADLTGVDPELLAEVMQELDRYFNWVEPRQAQNNLIGGEEEELTLSNDSGFSTDSGEYTLFCN